MNEEDVVKTVGMRRMEYFGTTTFLISVTRLANSSARMICQNTWDVLGGINDKDQSWMREHQSQISHDVDRIMLEVRTFLWVGEDDGFHAVGEGVRWMLNRVNHLSFFCIGNGNDKQDGTTCEWDEISRITLTNSQYNIGSQSALQSPPASPFSFQSCIEWDGNNPRELGHFPCISKSECGEIDYLFPEGDMEELTWSDSSRARGHYHQIDLLGQLLLLDNPENSLLWNLT